MMHENDIEIGVAFPVGPFTLTIENDDGGGNPWEEWDCQTPIAACGLREGVTVHDSGDGILDPLASAKPSWVSHHWRALCSILDLDQETEARDAADDAAYDGYSMGDVRKDRFETALGEMRSDSWGHCVEHFDAVAAIWNLRGVPAGTFQRNGYSQGDSVCILLVATPEHAARCGFDLKKPGHDIAASLESDASLYGAWAFGDVFGYSIKDDEGDDVDSCWGFYGCPWGNNPGSDWAVFDAAKEALAGAFPKALKAAQADAAKAMAAKLEAAKLEAGWIALGAPAMTGEAAAHESWVTSAARVSRLRETMEGLS